MFGVQVFENDTFVLPDFGDLLIGWRGLEKRGVEPFGERPVRPSGRGKRPGKTPEPLCASWPARCNGAVADGNEHVGSFGYKESRRLQVWNGDDPIRIWLRIETHTDGVFRVRTAGGAFPRQTGLGKTLPFEKLPVVHAKASITEHFDGLVEVSDDEPGDEQSHGLLVRRVGVPDEHHIAAGFVRGSVAGRHDAAGGVVVPESVFLVGGVLFFGKRDRSRSEREGGFDDDRLCMPTVMRLP